MFADELRRIAKAANERRARKAANERASYWPNRNWEKSLQTAATKGSGRAAVGVLLPTDFVSGEAYCRYLEGPDLDLLDEPPSCLVGPVLDLIAEIRSHGFRVSIRAINRGECPSWGLMNLGLFASWE